MAISASYSDVDKSLLIVICSDAVYTYSQLDNRSLIYLEKSEGRWREIQMNREADE